MFYKKTVVFSLIMGVLMCGRLFAGDIGEVGYFNGYELNNSINNYISSVSGLIPDITTLQNVWAYTPGAGGGKFWLGAGFNGYVSFLDKGSQRSGGDKFGADNLDLTQFPNGVPYLPGIAFDLRGGFGSIDFGVCGMWVDESAFSEGDAAFFGSGSSFALRGIGLDVRYRVLKAGVLWPSVTVQAGYYYTMHRFGITAESAGNRESAKVEFRNDTYLIGAQIAKGFLANIFTPYLGLKLIISKTDSEYEWHTNRAVVFNDNEFPYLGGVSYYSAGNAGNVDFYGQIYAGIGLSLTMDKLSNYMFVIGGAYTIGTNHFSLNAALRFMIGG